jgi:membrane-associated phospholipid phosphatase
LIGLVYALLTGSAFQVIVKTVIGGLRPHFLSECKPDISSGATQHGLGFEVVMYDRSICTGNKGRIDNALVSFPSGHTNIAFAGFVYLYLYLNAKLKVFSDHQPAYWMLVLTYIPILGATLIAGTLVITANHHWYDVMAGAVIGTVMAVSSYRVMYAAVWDYRVNHIPLSRNVPYRYCYGPDQAFGGFASTVFTRSAGWGVAAGDEVMAKGAPGDMLPWDWSQGAGMAAHGSGHQREYGMQGGVINGASRKVGVDRRGSDDMV